MTHFFHYHLSLQKPFIMKTQLVLSLIFGIAPFFLIAQDQPNSDKKIKGIITTIKDFETYFDGAGRSPRQVVVYSDPDFCGESLVLNSDWNAAHHRNPWNDKIASIEIPRGYEAWLYEHTEFRGRNLVITGNWSIRDNPWWDHRISSIRLVSLYDQDQPRRRRQNGHRHGYPQDCQREPGVILYAKKDFSGPSLTIFDDWSVRHSDDFWNDRISSIHIPAGYEVVIYKHAGFRGRSTTLKGPWPRRRHRDFWDDWNDEISSIEVFRRY